MLVLTRKVGERIVVGDNITIVVNRIGGNRVTIGIEAPDDVPVIRGELEAIVRQFEETADDEKDASAPFPRLAYGDADSSSPAAAALVTSRNISGKSVEFIRSIINFRPSSEMPVSGNLKPMNLF